MAREEIKEAIKVMQALVDGRDTEFIEGYKCATNKAIEWFNKKMYCLMIDKDGTLGEQFRNEMLEGLDLFMYEKPESHYRPFHSAEEVMEAIKEHGDWLKYKGAYCHICVVYNHCCDFNGFSLEYKDTIKNDVKFKDGTPFGVKED